MFNQDEDFQLAIRKKRARIEEINLILAQPRQSGTTEGFAAGLIEERLHLGKQLRKLRPKDIGCGYKTPIRSSGGRISTSGFLR